MRRDPTVRLLQSAYYAGDGGDGASGGLGATPVLLSQVGSGAKTVMTFKVKKADVDAFAEGVMDADEFRDRVAVNSY